MFLNSWQESQKSNPNITWHTTDANATEGGDATAGTESCNTDLGGDDGFVRTLLRKLKEAEELLKFPVEDHEFSVRQFKVKDDCALFVPCGLHARSSDGTLVRNYPDEDGRSVNLTSRTLDVKGMQSRIEELAEAVRALEVDVKLTQVGSVELFTSPLCDVAKRFTSKEAMEGLERLHDKLGYRIQQHERLVLHKGSHPGKGEESERASHPLAAKTVTRVEESMAQFKSDNHKRELDRLRTIGAEFKRKLISMVTDDVLRTDGQSLLAEALGEVSELQLALKSKLEKELGQVHDTLAVLKTLSSHVPIQEHEAVPPRLYKQHAPPWKIALSGGFRTCFDVPLCASRRV